MPEFTASGYRIAFLDEGEGPPILLIHGFASSARVNWVSPGWVDVLVKAGRRVIALDNRGHGASDKPHAVEAYRLDALADDARALLDHLGIPKADVMGYSMGARITAVLALAHPGRVRTAIFGGLGSGMLSGVGPWEPVVAALEAEDPATVTDPIGQMFRKFADQTKSDRVALAACMKATRQPIAAEQLGRLAVPVLVAVGDKDELAGDAAGLAAVIPGAEAVAIPGRNHMLAVGDKVYKQAVLDFLARTSPVPG
ncbi:alpha/beta fold hydrolase [Prosthecomicrobium pneumaticum]|uniref:Pimeloyl-ACP methyl ester carboxylesterase n=1 Tax=Prosthecomicrobium pneumaticum TaxID=81895 RepID=A0A7W9L3E7_9HYPH|nr:alpha/beta hydrolase [Prosthecomicrobium pneumaticum]MBB5754419.1 pimeloyl-ACP methyl ester carboxylesterase [Prosthecomicrobium pneumaticum]